MPQSRSEIIRQSFALGKIGLNTSLQIVALSPIVVGAALLSGTITLPVAASIMSSMTTLPLYSTAGCAAAPVLFGAGQRLLTKNLALLPNQAQPIAEKISNFQPSEIDDSVTLRDILPAAPLQVISSKLTSCSTTDSFQVGKVYGSQIGISASPDDWVVLENTGEEGETPRPNL